MDERIHSIEELLFVLLKRHTAFNGQFSIGVHRRFCGREFAPAGDKPPPADADHPVELLNAPVLQAADFVFNCKVSRLFHRRPGYRSRAPPPPICFHKKTDRRYKNCEITAKVIMQSINSVQISFTASMMRL